MTPADLYAAHLRVLQRFVYYRLPSRADADDVLQEIALAVLSAKELPEGGERRKAWLLGIARHKCADYFRGAYREAPFACEGGGRRPGGAEPVYTQTRVGLDVRDCLSTLHPVDQQILALAYLEDRPQAEIAARLGIPPGTVKSRLHTAKAHFRENYDYEGEKPMKELPLILPEYKIEPIPLPPFEVRCEELIGWCLIPRLGEKLTWGLYDLPERTRTELYEMEAVGRASVHGVEGVELTARELGGGQHEADQRNDDLKRTFIAQLTYTHVRFLAESHMENGVRRCFTFLDGDAFLDNWGFGEDNRGKEIHLAPKGLITRDGDSLTARSIPSMDVVGRCAVTLGGKRHDTICLMDLEAYDTGVCAEQFIDRAGRTVLWRRFNHNDWHSERYGMPWTEKLPANERLVVNGETYVHWYDCITEYVA
ncbi:MAG: RNA polymerase sigma factor [Oscillospiraceae bacterium]|jgi:RNA polymerase sigma factor (sigma-70 family)|nr:RNA polymerase sigma factor [Oscillospiraceae bacterium]